MPIIESMKTPAIALDSASKEVALQVSRFEILSDAIESLHQACMEQTEEGFLQSSMYHFHRLLRADYVIAGHYLHDESHRVQTDIILQRGIIIPNMVYDLKGTPCEIVENRHACSYPYNVADLFPHDRFLRDKAIEGYVGAPIVDCFGKLNGLVVALTQNPITDQQVALTLAKLFAVAVSPLFPHRKS